MGPLKRSLLVITILSILTPASNGGEDWTRWYPLKLGDRREYLVDYKGQEIWDGVVINKSYKEDGQEYFVMANKKFDIEYHMSVDQSGAYLRRWRYPFPVFKFLHYTVGFDPPIPVINFPLKVGKEWVYVGRASVWFLGRDIAIAYRVVSEGYAVFPFGDVHCFEVNALINDGSGLYETDYIYGKGYGYVKGRDPDRLDIMVDFIPGKD